MLMSDISYYSKKKKKKKICSMHIYLGRYYRPQAEIGTLECMC